MRQRKTMKDRLTTFSLGKALFGAIIASLGLLLSGTADNEHDTQNKLGNTAWKAGVVTVGVCSAGTAVSVIRTKREPLGLKQIMRAFVSFALVGSAVQLMVEDHRGG